MIDNVPLAKMRWRTGRKLGRTIYAMLESEATDQDVLIGMMDSHALAQQVVRDHNHMLTVTMIKGSLD